MTRNAININRKVIIIDDMPSIHEDITKVLQPTENNAALDALESDLFSDDTPSDDILPAIEYIIDSAVQGRDGYNMVKAAVEQNKPYALAFVDMRMPPGWDGLETIEHLWQVDPKLQVVICSAYSDHSWADIRERLGCTDRLLILKKPFDPVEVAQMADSMTHKWSLERMADEHMERLDDLVRDRTRKLEQTHNNLKQEVAERQKVEEELRLAQKLEAVGQLAAGIAHEINTPIQFISDSIYCLQEAFGDIWPVIDAARELAQAAEITRSHQAQVAALRAAEVDADLDYNTEQIPTACARALSGLERVGGIVRAMRNFSHMDHEQWAPTDLNTLLTNTLTIASSEYKYVADLNVDLCELPEVVCHPGELGQVFLNLIVNAAHAIDESRTDNTETTRRGRITVRSHHCDDYARVIVEDSGNGIPDEIKHRVYDQFFTTKAVGKGTGQGLSLARRIIVERHGGRIYFDSTRGAGTKFTVEIPYTNDSRRKNQRNHKEVLDA